MKKKRLIGVVVTAVILVLAVAYLWAPGSAPRGFLNLFQLGMDGPFESAGCKRRREEGHRPAQPWIPANVTLSRRQQLHPTGYET
jgi:hypothetical protein